MTQSGTPPSKAGASDCCHRSGNTNGSMCHRNHRVKPVERTCKTHVLRFIKPAEKRKKLRPNCPIKSGEKNPQERSSYPNTLLTPTTATFSIDFTKLVDFTKHESGCPVLRGILGLQWLRTKPSFRNARGQRNSSTFNKTLPM